MNWVSHAALNNLLNVIKINYPQVLCSLVHSYSVFFISFLKMHIYKQSTKMQYNGKILQVKIILHVPNSHPPFLFHVNFCTRFLHNPCGKKQQQTKAKQTHSHWQNTNIPNHNHKMT